MKQTDIFQILLYFVLLIALAIPLGRYMFKVYTGERTLLDGVLRPLERLTYRLAGIDAEKEMGWREYTVTLLVFNFLGIALLFLLELVQGYLPFNPQQFGPETQRIAHYYRQAAALEVLGMAARLGGG